jgi:GR25 family glycosyltransferase involved in LPS biosynthesis
MDHNTILFLVILLEIILIIMASTIKKSYFGNIEIPRKIDISRAPVPEVQKEIPAKIICLTDKEYQDTSLLVSKYFGSCEKFNAIRGSDLYDFIKNPSNVSIRAVNNIINENYRRAHADLGSMNAIGCALSHYTIWSDLKPGTGVCVFEADAILHADPIPFIKKVGNAHLIIFGTIFSIPNKKQEQTLTKLNNRFYGTQGYYISYDGAQILMKNFFPIDEQIDSYMSDFILIQNNPLHKFTDFNSYIITPGICTQFNKTGSTIQTKGIVCDV